VFCKRYIQKEKGYDECATKKRLKLLVRKTEGHFFVQVPMNVYASHPRPLFWYAIHRQLSDRSSSRPDTWVSVDISKTDRFSEDFKPGNSREAFLCFAESASQYNLSN